jgi:hypothetical protein
MRDVEPTRLFEADDAPAPLQDLLRRAQQDVPTPDEAARLVRSVEAGMAAPVAAGKPTRSPWLPRERRVPGKLIVAVILAGVGTVGYFVVQRHVSAPATAVAPSPKAPTPVVPAPQPRMEALAPLPAVQEQAETPVKARDAVRTRGKHREAVRHPTPPESASTQGASSDEFALLRAARQAVAAQPGRALRLTEEHAQRFPQGMLAQEREAIAIEALAKLGRATQAQARAQTFLKAHPGSPYRPRIDAALARLSGSRPSP